MTAKKNIPPPSENSGNVEKVESGKIELSKSIDGLPKGFKSVKNGLPSVKPYSKVASTSKHLHLILANGKTGVGTYQRWDRDMNGHHLKAKKGEGFFHTLDGVWLTNVVGYQEI